MPATPGLIVAARRATACPACAARRAGRSSSCRWWRRFGEHMQPAFVEIAARRLAARRAGEAGAAAHHDLRRRRDARAHRGGHRQPAAVPHGRRARARAIRGVAGFNSRCSPGARPRDGGTAARAASSVARPTWAWSIRATPRAQPGPRGAGRCATSCALPWAACSSAAALPQLVNGRRAMAGMETLHFAFDGGRVLAPFAPALVGVVASGNLEVLVEVASGTGCRIDIDTSRARFRPDLGSRAARLPRPPRPCRPERVHPRHGRDAGRGPDCAWIRPLRRSQRTTP